MTTNLPFIEPEDFKTLVNSPESFVSEYLSRFHPQIEFTKVKAIGINAFFGEYLLVFELLHADVWGGRPMSFRTGKIQMGFREDGTVGLVRWASEALYDEDGVLPIRPLWLPSEFWDFIPLDEKMKDEDYSLDPFEGAADSTPVKAHAPAAVEVVPQPTAHIRNCLRLGKLPTLNDILLQMYGAFEGEHVQFVAPWGSLKIRGDGCLVASFDIYNPSGRYVKTDMWHAGHFEIVFNKAHEIESVEHSQHSRNVDHPFAYRYAPEYAPRALWKYIGIPFQVGYRDPSAL